MESQNNKEKASYKSILKATSLFGGLQIYIILIQVIRSKVIAVLLGPVGVGIEGLFKSGIELVQNVVGLGLANSAVREVADAKGTNDENKISRVIFLIKKLVWLTGLLGLFIFAVLSPWLSQFTFGNQDYTVPFILLSVILLFDQICAGQKVVLQGLSKYKQLAKATAYGTTVGLLVSVPMYYFIGVDGIVPTLILNSLCALLFSWHFSKQIPVKKTDMGIKKVFSESQNMIKMGFSICLSTAEAGLIAYLLRSYIRLEDGTESVGFFQAGFVLVTSYVGLVFNAMSTDFYPRLANVNKDNLKCRRIINEQGVVASCLLTPIVVAFITFLPIVIYILYTNEFQVIGLYILWASLGMMFRLSSWLVSFMFLAKGVAKLFIVNETIAKLYFFVLNIIGYKFGGLEGLGIAFALSYFIYTIQVYAIAHVKYGFQYSLEFLRLFLLMLVFVMITIVLCKLPLAYRYSLGSLMVIISLMTSYKILDKKMNVGQLIRAKLRTK